MTSSGIQGVEPVIAALKVRLDAELPGEVILTNSDHTDYPLSAPTVLDYLPTPQGEMGEFPLVGIGERRGRLEDDTGWSATGVYEVMVIAWDQDADQRALAFKLRRWERCLLRASLKNRRLTDPRSQVGWGLTAGDLLPGPTFELEDPRTYLSWRAVTITARSDEE